MYFIFLIAIIKYDIFCKDFLINWHFLYRRQRFHNLFLCFRKRKNMSIKHFLVYLFSMVFHRSITEEQDFFIALQRTCWHLLAAVRLSLRLSCSAFPFPLPLPLWLPLFSCYTCSKNYCPGIFHSVLGRFCMRFFLCSVAIFCRNSFHKNDSWHLRLTAQICF